MELRVQNLGPLKDVTLPIRMLNVIIGPNHQGKTWLAYVLYGLALEGQRGPGPPVLKELPGDAALGRPTDLLGLFRSIRDESVRRTRDRLRVFFQDSSGIVDGARLELLVSDEEQLVALRRHCVESTDGCLLPRRSGTQRSDAPWSSEDILAEMFRSVADSPLNLGRPFALPAERNSLILVYKLLSARRTRLLRDVRRNRLAPEEAEQRYRELGEPRFPQPIEDFLDFLSDVEIVAGAERRVEQQPEPARAREHLATALEGALQGDHRLHWEAIGLGGHDLMLNVGGDRPLDLHNASSAVKQLAPLLLWLRSWRPDDLLIIDEPELNLHPVAQAKLLEGLAILVSLGVRVVLTTHSPYLLSHLNNLIAAHPTDQAVRDVQAKHLYMQDSRAFLSPDQVGAWQLDQGELRDLYDPDWGIRWDTLSEASEEIQRRYFAIQEEAPAETDDGAR